MVMISMTLGSHLVIKFGKILTGQDNDPVLDGAETDENSLALLGKQANQSCRASYP